MNRLALTAAALLALLAVPAGSASPQADMDPRLVRTIVDPQLGRVLTRANRQALYVWNRERDGKVRCTGACAKAWPPLIVRKGVVVPMHVAGIKGDFGTVRRANGARQLTFNKRPLYAYAHEKPGQVLCNDVDGWFAVKVRA
jgi:predicted lipoprotein with Yx(FWY)xxD motif